MNNLKAFSLGLSVLVLSSLAGAASNGVASQDERNLLCRAVGMLLVVENVDAYVDTACQQLPASTEAQEDGTTKVTGSVVIKTREDRLPNALTCEVVYEGTPSVANIVGGLANGLSCH